MAFRLFMAFVLIFFSLWTNLQNLDSLCNIQTFAGSVLIIGFSALTVLQGESIAPKLSDCLDVFSFSKRNLRFPRASGFFILSLFYFYFDLALIYPSLALRKISRIVFNWYLFRILDGQSWPVSSSFTSKFKSWTSPERTFL